MEKYTIDRPIWRSSDSDTKDYEGYFMVGFNIEENSIYIAVVTQDHMNIQKKGDIESGDLYVLFLDEEHHERGSGILRYKISEHDKSMTSKDQLWDDDLAKRLNWNDVEYKVVNNESTTVYEIKVHLQKPLYEGRVLGMGHLIQDVDQDKETVYACVEGGDKDYNGQPGRIGHVMLVSDDTKYGDLSGKVGWNDGDEDLRPEGIRIVTQNGDWIYTNLDDGATFQIRVPYGEYQLKPGKTAFFDPVYAASRG